jgi:nicotinamidase-related amidase
MARRGVFERTVRLASGRTALLLVDMQRGFLGEGEAMEVPAARAIMPAIRGLMDLCRERRAPVVSSEFTYDAAAPALPGELHAEHGPAAPGARRGFAVPSGACLAGDPGAETVPALRPRSGELVVRKAYDDAVHGTPLDGALRARGITSLIVTCTMTDICVLATAISGFNRDYRMVVVEDGVATLWPEIQQASLDIMGRACARGLPAVPVMDAMRGWA